VLQRSGSDSESAIQRWPSYALVVIGLAVLIVPRAGLGRHAARGARQGALFGTIVYSAGDLTKLSVIEDWRLPVTLADHSWGAVICALTTDAIAAAERL
jgi:uncharacterized membrane protein